MSDDRNQRGMVGAVLYETGQWGNVKSGGEGRAHAAIRGVSGGTLSNLVRG